MTLKDMQKLQGNIYDFKKWGHDFLTDDEWHILSQARNMVKDYMERQKQTPEGKAELLADKVQECPID